MDQVDQLCLDEIRWEQIGLDGIRLDEEMIHGIGWDWWFQM